MKRRNDLPAGWRQPPETTAEPVPLRRPYVPPGDVFAPADPLPPPPSRPRFFTRRPPAAPGPGPGRPARVPAPAPPPQAQAQPQRLPAMRQWRPMRAILGDEYRAPALWCEFGSCIARFTSSDARGERDLRSRALAAGWTYDAAGRLACPGCSRPDAAFQARRPQPAYEQDPWRRPPRRR
jgi:hypothetical protein